jgi:hypothetical protein
MDTRISTAVNGVGLVSPVLLVPIFYNDELVRYAEVPDPRPEFIQSFNRAGEKWGLRAGMLAEQISIAVEARIGGDG